MALHIPTSDIPAHLRARLAVSKLRHIETCLDYDGSWKIDLTYTGHPDDMLTQEQTDNMQNSMDNLNRMRQELDFSEIAIKNLNPLTNTFETARAIATDAARIASEAIAQASYYCGIIYGQESKLNDLEAHQSPKLGPKELAEQLSGDMDFMQAVMRLNPAILAETAKYWVDQYAIWKDGEQLVGCLQRPKKDVFKDIDKFYEQPQ